MTLWLDRGRHGYAVGAARRLLSLDPLHEAACRTLMRVHADRGERSQALRLFEALRGRLERELDVAPEPETLSLYRSIRSRRAKGAEPAEAPAAAPSATRPGPVDRGSPAKPSVAVLPFATGGDDREQDGFADGLTEDIITDLSRVPGLVVAARHNAFGFKGKAVEARDAAQELKVGHILQGRVRVVRSRVRITTQLLDGASGAHLWAERYDRDLDDVLALQGEIAGRIVSVLKGKLVPEAPAGPSAIGMDAEQYYRVGRGFYLRGLDRHGLSLARKMFGKAIALAPGHARAYAALATSESHLSMSDPEVTYESSLANSLRALELDPGLAEAHAARGLVLYADGRFAEAAPAFELALSLGPELHETHFLFARNCRLRGLHERAAGHFARAAELRPDDYRALGLLASEHKILGRLEDFEAAARGALERAAAAVEALPENADALAFGSALLAELGETARAKAWAERAVTIGPEDSLVHYNVARAYAFLGEPGVALDWLERAFRSAPEWRRRLAQWMTRDDDVDSLRGQPRFRALLRRLEAELGPRSRANASAKAG